MELRFGRPSVPSWTSGLRGKVEPRSTHRGNSRVRLLTDVSWKAAGYLGAVPVLSLSSLSCPPTPQLLFFPQKKKISESERSPK